MECCFRIRKIGVVYILKPIMQNLLETAAQTEKCKELSRLMETPASIKPVILREPIVEC